MKSSFLKLIFMGGVVIVVCVGYGFWYTALATKSATVASLQKQIDTKLETTSRISSARTALAEVSGDEALVQNYFVPETNMVSFIDGLQTKGKAQGATVNVLSVSAGTGAQPMFALSLTIKGSFDAVMRTVGVIEYSPYYVSISGLSLVKDDKNNWQADLKLLVGSVPSATGTSITSITSTTS